MQRRVHKSNNVRAAKVVQLRKSSLNERSNERLHARHHQANGPATVVQAIYSQPWQNPWKLILIGELLMPLFAR